MTFRLRVRVVPNARRNELAGMHGEAIKIKVAAPALEGKANEELVQFLAKSLGLPRRSVALISGEKSRDKLIEIGGLDEAKARAILIN